MTLKKTLIAALCVLGSTAPASAHEFRAAYGDWAFDVSGTATNRNRAYDFERDLAAHRAGGLSLQVAWDTGPGWWKPDLSFSHSRIGVEGSHSETGPTGSLPPLPQTGTVNLAVDSDFTDQELVLRYPLNSGPVKVSPGLAAKRLKGTVRITDSRQGQASRGDYDEVFPEAHLGVRWTIAHWLVMEAVAQGIQYNDATASDFRAAIELHPIGPILIEAGWQQKHYDFSANGDALDVTLQGALVRAGFLFR